MFPASARALPLLAALLLLLPTAASAEWREVSYADMAKMPMMLARLDPQKVFSYRFKAQPGKGFTALPSDYRVQVKVGGKLIPVPVRPDGTVDLPIRQDWIDAGAVLQSNQPKGRAPIRMDLNSRTPAGTRMSYAQLTEAGPILEKGIREMAGMMRFMAPGVESFTLMFEKAPQTVVLTLPGGKKRSWKTDAKGLVVLPWEPKWAAGLVELSAPLKGIDQTLK